MATLVWTVINISLLDVSIDRFFQLPADPRAPISVWSRYFDYGRSIEGKLKRLEGPTPQQSASIMSAGWLSRTCDVPSHLVANKVNFDIYGMSFSNRIADEMERIDPAVAGTRFAGPAAPLNHSYACFVRRNEGRQTESPIQILGILQSSIPRLVTIGGLTTSFEGPEPFGYPRYFLAPDGQLAKQESNIMSEVDLREALANRGKWKAYVEELQSNDFFFSSSVFEEDVFDKSVVGRMLRRAWGQRVQGMRVKRLQLNEGEGSDPDILPVIRALIIDFAKRARTAGQIPIVILIEDQGSEQDLAKIATPTLISNDVPFISTSAVAPPNDPANFVSDGHFTATANRRVVKAVLELLEAEASGIDLRTQSSVADLR